MQVRCLHDGVARRTSVAFGSVPSVQVRSSVASIRRQRIRRSRRGFTGSEWFVGGELTIDSVGGFGRVSSTAVCVSAAARFAECHGWRMCRRHGYAWIRPRSLKLDWTRTDAAYGSVRTATCAVDVGCSARNCLRRLSRLWCGRGPGNCVRARSGVWHTSALLSRLRTDRFVSGARWHRDAQFSSPAIAMAVQ